MLEESEPSGWPMMACIFSSILAAGVSGVSDGLFRGTTGVTDGDKVGRAAELDDGVDNGVTILAVARGTEWWWAIDWSCNVCC